MLVLSISFGSDIVIHFQVIYEFSKDVCINSTCALEQSAKILENTSTSKWIYPFLSKGTEVVEASTEHILTHTCSVTGAAA